MAGDITLDADIGGGINLADGGTTFGTFTKVFLQTHFVIDGHYFTGTLGDEDNRHHIQR